MSLAQHRKVVQNSLKTSDEFKRLFDYLGNLDTPGGKIYAAYRTANRALKGNLGKARTVAEILATMRDAIETATGKALNGSIDIGLDKAEFERRVYSLPKPKPPQPNIKPQLTSILAVVDNQITTVKSAVALDMDEDSILGDDSRVGLLTPAPVTREADRWIVALAMLTYTGSMSGSLRAAGKTREFVKQAIAVLDGSTTNTCLQVHGQVTEVNGVFKLEGTPRYANEMEEPPFHHNCRTTTCIVQAEDASDRFTDDLLDEATEVQKQQREVEEGRVSERIRADTPPTPAEETAADRGIRG